VTQEGRADAATGAGASHSSETWTAVIRPPSGWFDLHLRDLWRYRDLVALFVRRDFVANYSQTLLGPLWFLIQPLLTTFMFTIIFSRVARIPTDGLPPMLFYMCGVVAWSYFAGCVSKTSLTFVANANLFGKVWFPRLAVPLSVVISNLVAFGIQFGLLLLMLGWHLSQGLQLRTGLAALLAPLLVLQMALLALGFGIIISSLTSKYRDLTHLVAFGVQLWMFATPVVYPAARVPPRWQWLMYANPMAPVVESFRYVLLGAGTVRADQVVAGLVSTVLVVLAGVVLFSRIEKTFMDTV
jgi:lipopolysaccharide transport system permease protein